MSLLSALAFCAFAAQNALAWETASGTTVFECSKSAAILDHTDAHCDNTTSNGTYGHKEIAAGGKVDIETSNTATKEETKAAETAILEGELLGASVKITCHKVEPDTEATSWVQNVSPGDFEGTSAVDFTECTLEGNGASLGCHVEEPVTVAALFHGVEQTVGAERQMAIEFSPDPSTSTTFVTIHFGGTGCLVATANVKGKARGTGSGADASGATLRFQPADEELTFGGNPTKFTGVFTAKIKETGNSLVVTTPQSPPPSWETASNTTVFECSKAAAAKDYSDAHCDSQNGVTYGHKAMSPGKVVEIETSNTATKSNTTEAEPVVLKSEVLGSALKIACDKVEPDSAVSSWVKNVSPGDFEGTSAAKFSECTLEGNGASAGCHVEEPITWASSQHAVERGAREMAIEFTPDPTVSSTIFVTLHFSGTGCLVTEGNVKGRTRGTGSGTEASGATLKFLPADEELTFAGNAATLEGVFTTKVVATGNALVTTTTE
ncbi:MAG TPA: hypothetical protein VMH33_09340 [Solirubrobacterales bacterium]|nr:hypothetical protein [Solirubrobacterales bacterium]